MTEITSARLGAQRAPVGYVAGIAITCALLCALGDFLLFGHWPGLNLAVLVLAIGAATLFLCREALDLNRAGGALLLLLIAVLPLLEAFTLSSFLTALLSLSLLSLLVWRKLPEQWIEWPAALIRFGLVAPWLMIDDLLHAALASRRTGLGRTMVRGLVVWIVPIACALVFLLLFANANPVIDDVLAHFNFDWLERLLDPDRIILWVIIAGFAWPLLLPRILPRGVKAEPKAAPSFRRESLLFGRAAILRSLVVFNLLFGVQTLLDITYLWSGAALPDGLTHADYAHRGAYPLIVTALLAAAFVLAAMRPNGPANQSRPIRWLVYLWVGQNVLLVVSSILRLELYVEVYSLTELRLAAGIWMGLVAVGLILIIARIALNQSNTWLVATNALALALTVAGLSFVDFGAVIARFNVDHSRELTGDGMPLDLMYLRYLGPASIPAIDQLIARSHEAVSNVEVAALRQELVAWFNERDRDWRSWNWRDQRLAAYLGSAPGCCTAWLNGRN